MPPNYYDSQSEEQYVKSDLYSKESSENNKAKKRYSRSKGSSSKRTGTDHSNRVQGKNSDERGKEKYSSSKKKKVSRSSRKVRSKKTEQESSGRTRSSKSPKNNIFSSSLEARVPSKRSKRIRKKNNNVSRDGSDTPREETPKKRSISKRKKASKGKELSENRKRNPSHKSSKKRLRRIPEPQVLINLKEEREGLELTREQISRQARIPVEYIVALETGVYKNLRKGKTTEKYKKRYLYFLDLPLHAELVTPLPSVSPRKMGFIHTITTSSFDDSPRRAVTKVIMAAMIIVIFIVSVLKFVSVISEKSEETTSVVQVPSSISTVSKTTFDGVKLRAIGHSKATIHADGELIHKGKLEPMKHMKFPYRNKLVIEIEKIGSVDVYSNGRRVRPQGNLQGGRTLTFVRSENDL